MGFIYIYSLCSSNAEILYFSYQTVISDIKTAQMIPGHVNALADNGIDTILYPLVHHRF